MAKCATKEELERDDVFGVGPVNTICAEYIPGDSFLKPLTDRATDGVFVVNVSFAPGVRNRWHIHHAQAGGGHVLLCTAGEGWYQEEGKDPVELVAGKVIVVPANVKHWHGAKADSWFSHVAVDMPGTATRNEWLESVSDEEYAHLA